MDQTFSALLCVTRVAGTGNARLFADADNVTEIRVYNSGLLVGDAGTDI